MRREEFTKITRKSISNISEQIIAIYIGKSMEKVTYIWKIKLSRPWTFDNVSDFVSFLTSTDSSNSEVFVDVWLSLDESIGEFSTAYKNMSALVWRKVYNHDFALNLVRLNKVCLHIPKD